MLWTLSRASRLLRPSCTKSLPGPVLRTAPLSRNLQTTSTASPPPHAYLEPLDLKNHEKPEELEGAMCLVMNREKARNALSVQMVHEMREGIAKVNASTSARLLLLHTPFTGMFCAGADLRERATMSQTQVSDFLNALRSMMQELEGLSVPTISVVDGFAMGGGTELALSCDLRVGGPKTTMALPETKLGIIPGAGGTQRLTRLVGVAKAKELIYTGRRIEGIEAERIGLVNLLAREPSSAWDAALALSRQILTSAPLALRAAKMAIDSAVDLPLEQGLDMERKAYATLLDSEDRKEGLRAFAEKRRAKFQGK
ncbi:ClpP/crotonase-like domain-containing protein [Kockovaella imperatae]|uniref:ClpP/crotonase-like domain-containing protein n=1 Tax=Kockovaella imperatae TaxID=4999 RepID=A0A1Y1UEU5_9TREE|nr:ClpP/crotonase-like domain-containing protein [Kockovaella imperatae]ORX36580.1 ClpP/crotonase-like domain-containing protein [Kockovaella imperatae]